MAKKQKEPELIESPIKTPMLNYDVYYMKTREKLLTSLVALVAGGAVGLVFYGNLFLDGLGEPTKLTLISNVVVFLLAGMFGIKIIMPKRVEQLRAAREAELIKQFRSFLDSVSVSMATGRNAADSIASAYDDLKLEYGEKAYIVQELADVLQCMKHNIPLTKALEAFAERTGVDDIKNFVLVFSISYSAGGNMADIVRRANGILSDKLEIDSQIETIITSNKSQFDIMMVVPVLIVFMLRTMSSDFAQSLSSPIGVCAITIAIGIFYGAYIMAQKILIIKG